MGHKYNPLQARDAHGRWVAKGGNAAFHLAKAGAKAASVGSGKKVGPIKIQNVKGRGLPPLTAKGALAELGKNTVPYVRVNKRSQTVGINAGTRIPYTRKRVVFGGYSRLESTTHKTGVDRFVAKHTGKVFPEGTRRGKVKAYISKNVSINNPAVRATVGGHQVRLGTSRGAGPTVIVRRGKHKTAQPKSQAGVQKYDTHMNKIAGKRAATKIAKPRRQRRTAAARKRK
jgi:hypothetical protein